jgi:hypothetical protein
VEDWVLRAMSRWPNVPALFGWLALDRRGRWLIRGEAITRPQIIETIDRNYAADEYGRWYFQNGPQRGYMTLAYAPLVLRAEAVGDSLQTHTGKPVARPSQAFLDEEGSILFVTEHGPGLLADADLDWALSRLEGAAGAVDEARLAQALALPSGAVTPLSLRIAAVRLPLVRLDAAAAPSALGFMRDPQPREGERWSK